MLLITLLFVYTVGEPLNKEAWHWYNDIAGDKRCTVVDTYWQTGEWEKQIGSL